MAPKGVDKAKQKEKEKIAIDKTFGMKNKNKSKVVQKYIKSITSNATGRTSKAEQDEKKAKEEKQKDIQKSALMNSLFNLSTDKKGRAFDAVAKKKAKQEEEEAIAAGKKVKEEIRKEIIEGIANTIRLTNVKGVRMSELGGHAIITALKEKHADTFKILQLLLFIKANNKVFWVDDPESTNPTIRCQEDVDAEVEPDERDIEEIIEERRRALPPGGTPVTEESFKAWKEKKAAEHAAEIEEKRKAAESSKKGVKSNSVGMSGKDLFTFDASLFVDAEDEGAVGADEYERTSNPDDEDDAPARTEAGRDDEEDEDEGEDVDEAEGEDDEGEGAGGARGSSEVAINKDIFLEGDDLPDDLDDLDDDE